MYRLSVYTYVSNFTRLGTIDVLNTALSSLPNLELKLTFIILVYVCIFYSEHYVVWFGLTYSFNYVIVQRETIPILFTHIVQMPTNVNDAFDLITML